MVTAVTSFGRSGLSDWLIQRASAVALAAYTLFIVIYLLMNPDLTYAQWAELFSHLWVRVFTLLVLLSIVAHARKIDHPTNIATPMMKSGTAKYKRFVLA